MININCFIINLKRCPEKRSRMIERMKKYPEIKYEIFNAIDGQDLSVQYMNNNNYDTLDEWTDPFQNRKTTKGEIGCTLSHYHVYEKAFSMENEITLVIEDDAEFSDDFIDKLNKTLHDLDTIEWDMCYLGRKKMNMNEEEEILTSNLLYSSYSYWTIGYLINQKFCEKIINSNLLQNIIVIDEYLSLIGNCSNLKQYRGYYNTSIDIVSVNKNIIYPEKDAFKNSDTEISTYLPNNNSKLLILTVATDNNEPLKRFIHSCNNYGLRYKILGLDYEWSGGNMADSPGGGMKLNLLKEELKNYKKDEIILFSDSYDVIFLSGEKEIMEKYTDYNSDIVFAGERKCWPNESIKTIFTGKGKYKYINSGGFIGKVDTIRKLIDVEFEDTYDDQYLIHSRYESFKKNILIDEECKIFQTSSNDTKDLEIMYQKNRLKNNVYDTYPCHYHGNGGKNTKVIYNNICNYLTKLWNPIYGYRLIKNYDITKSIYLFIYDKYENKLDYFFRNIEKLSYPKNKIYIKIFTNNTIKYNFSKEYISVDFQNYKSQEKEIRDESIKECYKLGYDYYLNIDTICMISEKDTIQKLISYDKCIVSPLLRLGDNDWSNFWGDIDDNGWYKQSFNYFDIIEYRHRGCWNVPYINNMYLIQKNTIELIHGFYSLNFQPNRGCDMAFCENCFSNNIYLHICNDEKYGKLIDPEEFTIKEKILEVNDTFDGNNIIIEDDFLDKNTLHQLLGFALTTEFDKSKNYIGGYQDFGFKKNNHPIPELNNVVKIIENKYPDIFKDLEYERGWFFIYDNECPGVTPHADPASINVNIWLTPNSCIKDNTKNGLIIWDKKRPEDWSYNDYNKDVSKIKQYLKESGASKQIVEYKHNRVMIFDSSYFHETNGVSMKDGHWNKRINLVFMFKPMNNKITLLDYNKNKEDYLKKYLHSDFLNSINNLDDLKIEEPISDVLQFPFVTDIFCKECIEICEKYGKWSGATNEDSRIGYENVPSNDIHFTEIKLNTIWEDIIKTYIAPVVSHHWGSYKTNNINIAFVVKYEHDKFYKLGPHHDSSAYTVNISLNSEYEGGEVRFIKANKCIKNKKGYALIHPGRITHYHEGLPVTRGTKYVCISFVN